MFSIPSWVKVAGRYSYRSLREFMFLIAFSFMPVWLGMLPHYLASETVLGYLNGYLINGEALLLSATTVGPLMFILVNSESGSKGSRAAFPLKWVYYLLIVAICAVAACLIGYTSASSGTGRVSNDAMWNLSLAVSVVSVILWFAVVGTNAAHEAGAPDIMRQDEEDFLRRYNAQ